jgi:hypothetical protein
MFFKFFEFYLGPKNSTVLVLQFQKQKIYMGQGPFREEINLARGLCGKSPGRLPPLTVATERSSVDLSRALPSSLSPAARWIRLPALSSLSWYQSFPPQLELLPSSAPNPSRHGRSLSPTLHATGNGSKRAVVSAVLHWSSPSKELKPRARNRRHCIVVPNSGRRASSSLPSPSGPASPCHHLL